MATIEERSTLTAKGQTTVPRAIRQFLGLKEGDELAFRVEGQQVVVVAVEAEHEDPIVGEFLRFLARDMAKRPRALEPLSREFAGRVRKLVKGTRVNLEAPIDGDVEL
ncbi:MAG: hypothetical protein RL653_2198 [Pseudomonadota bacterium]|jgi:antitoxin PrlF